MCITLLKFNFTTVQPVTSGQLRALHVTERRKYSKSRTHTRAEHSTPPHTIRFGFGGGGRCCDSVDAMRYLPVIQHIYARCYDNRRVLGYKIDGRLGHIKERRACTFLNLHIVLRYRPTTSRPRYIVSNLCRSCRMRWSKRHASKPLADLGGASFGQRIMHAIFVVVVAQLKMTGSRIKFIPNETPTTLLPSAVCVSVCREEIGSVRPVPRRGYCKTKVARL